MLKTEENIILKERKKERILRTIEGKKAEKTITKCIANSLEKSEKINNYYIFHDLNFPWGGGTLQIDQLLICQKGIFAIETKSWQGITFFLKKDSPIARYLRMPPDALKDIKNGEQNFYVVNLCYDHKEHELQIAEKKLEGEIYKISCRYSYGFNWINSFDKKAIDGRLKIREKRDCISNIRFYSAKLHSVLSLLEQSILPVLIFIDDENHHIVIPKELSMSLEELTYKKTLILKKSDIGNKSTELTFVKLLECQKDIDMDIDKLAKKIQYISKYNKELSIKVKNGNKILSW